MEEKVEAIVLKSIPFQDSHRIITIFSKEMGLLSLIVKKISSPHLLALTSPFCLGEFLFKRGRGELFSFQDGTLLDSLSFLRNDFASIASASRMGKAILDSHLPQSLASQLYPLFLSYLRQLPAFDKKENLVSSFFLKMLLHEGLLHLSSSCNVCKEKAASYLFRGESLCSLHQEKGAFSFSKEDWKIVEVLAYSRSYQILKTVELSEELQTKISSIFQELS
jgi:DNA repair protein RecO (recombination protein O)